MPFTAPLFKTLIITLYHSAEILDAKFYPNQANTVEDMFYISFMPFSKYGFHCTDFLGNHIY
jgi:hypothetical protein